VTPNFSLTPQANEAEGESERAKAAHSSRRVLVVGAGPVGHAWAKRLWAAGYTLRHWSRSMGPLWAETATREAADVVLLAVRDDAVAQAAQFVVTHGGAGAQSVLLHCAGALSPQAVFADVRSQVAGVGLLHPLRSFSAAAAGLAGAASDSATDGDLAGVVMAVAGDALGQTVACELATAVGGVPLQLSAEQLPVYHAAAVMAAGHVAAVLDAAAQLLRRIGLPRRQAELALTGLTRSVLDNVEQVGLPAALTGPFARGDVQTVQSHLVALNRISCEAADLYRTLGQTALNVAHRQARAEASALEQIAALLEPSPTPATR